MKKLSHLVLFLFVLFSSAAFASEDDAGPNRHPLDVHLTKTDTGDLPHLIQKRYIRILTTMNHTNFFLDGAKPLGFEYALLKEYENFLNEDITSEELRITFEFIPVSRNNLFDYLVAGYGDIAAAGLTITPAREKQVDFTAPYLTEISELLVTHKDFATVTGLEDLSGKEIFIRRSSSYFTSISSFNKALIEMGKAPLKIVEADEQLETEDILELVNSGAIKMTVCDSHIAGIWSKVLPDINVHENIIFRDGAQIAWAVRKNSPALEESLNEFIKTHRKGTLLGNIYFNRYYENKEWVKDPMKGSYSRKVFQYRTIFEKYAEAYGFDWRLLLAMAFQESGLDHNKQSHAGAVGVMQIRPSTASDPNVDIDEIDCIDNNIHAAVKYLAFIRNRYFSDGDILPRDQVRLSLAAYNAGPAKILKARKKAVEMNLDPNRWFRNVELAVLRLVGQETVRYVSNINKYYVIYNHALEAEDGKSSLPQ